MELALSPGLIVQLMIRLLGAVLPKKVSIHALCCPRVFSFTLLWVPFIVSMYKPFLFGEFL